MIYVCPNCGQSLSKPLKDGICICNNCLNLFDSSKQSKLLSAAWIARKKTYSSKQLQDKLLLTEDEANIIIDKINIECLSHQEFFVYLEKIQIANRCYL